jgi:hypothetical protein
MTDQKKLEPLIKSIQPKAPPPTNGSEGASTRPAAPPTGSGGGKSKPAKPNR